MKSYFCFIHVRPGSVPELRALSCESDDRVPAHLAATLNEWPSLHKVEVAEGDRTVISAKGNDLDAFRTNSPGQAVAPAIRPD